MSSPAKAPPTAAEFLVMNAANVLMNAERVRAVLVIVAFEPQPGAVGAPVVMNPWGGSTMNQVVVLRELADGLERAEAAAAAPQPTIN